MNSIQIIGNISTDIDLRATPNGKFVAQFNIAVNHPFNREKTFFLPVEVWGKSGENTAAYCNKGSKVGIVGHVEVDQWEKDGERKYKTKVVANSVEFLSQKNSQGNQQQTQRQPNTRTNDDPFTGSIPIQDDSLPF